MQAVLGAQRGLTSVIYLFMFGPLELLHICFLQLQSLGSYSLLGCTGFLIVVASLVEHRMLAHRRWLSSCGRGLAAPWHVKSS